VTRLLLIAGLAVILLLPLGCGPKAADPGAASATLRRVLDAWKAGESADSLAKASPPVTVVDAHWKKGMKLLDYEVAEPPTPAGYDLHFAVTLTVEDEKGKKKQQKTGYDVSTSPKLVVVRADDN
jgi:hypothetical protein